MDKKQRSAQRQFRRVRDFLAANPVVGTAGELGKQSQVLDEVIEQLAHSGEEQDANVRQSLLETRRQKALRDTLREKHMAPISRIARNVYGVPGMENALFMPKLRADSEALVDAARGMAQAAARDPRIFTDHGLAASFLDNLRSATDAIANAIPNRVDHRRRKTIATKTVAELVKRGRNAVRLLDAIVAPRLAGDPELLASWNTLKRPMEVTGPQAEPAPDTAAPVVKVA